MFKLNGGLKIAGAVVVGIVFFFGTLWALNFLTPTVAPEKPALAETPPLPKATRTSVVIAPTAIAISAISKAIEDAAPRSISGKPESPIAKVLSKSQVVYTLERSPLIFTGRTDVLTISTDLNGALRITGQLPNNLNDVIGALTDPDAQQNGAAKNGKPLDLRADLKGRMTITSRPKITPRWRIEANLVGRTELAEANLQVAGIRFNGAREIRFLVDRAMSDQMLALGARVREDALIENAARREWAKLCRSFPLDGTAPGLPQLFLESRPTRAFASQPRVDASAITVTLGIESETRIVPQKTKPDCPFPEKLELVPPMDQGKIAISLPIDIPFAEINKLIDAHLKGKTFPDDGSGPAQVTVLSTAAAADGDRIVISMLVRARENKSWFGLGGEATLHIAGKPVLDQERQSLRLDNLSLAVESEAAFGLLGAAARAAVPALESALSRHAILDLRPALANARKSIDKAVADFRIQEDGIKADAQITGLRLTGVEFDANVVRITAEIDGVARVSVTKLPGRR
jgi:hypothetical protein